MKIINNLKEKCKWSENNNNIVKEKLPGVYLENRRRKAKDRKKENGIKMENLIKGQKKFMLSVTSFASNLPMIKIDSLDNKY